MLEGTLEILLSNSFVNVTVDSDSQVMESFVIFTA